MAKKNKKVAGSKTIERMQEKAKEEKRIRKKKQIEKEKAIKEKKQIELDTIEWKEQTEKDKNRIETVAYALSRKYRYHKLMLAADIETARVEGREVHGYMKRMFPDYDWLVDNDVFDLACYFAMKNYQLEIFNVIKNYDFENALVNIIDLPENVYFDIYPEFDFNKIVVLTQGEPFENAVHWIENHPWIDEEGYDTTVTLAPCNLLNTGFTLWDLPVTVLKDAVGKDKLFFEAKTTAKELMNMEEQLLKKHIYEKRQEEKTMVEKVEDFKIRYEQLEERHQYLKDTIRAGDTTDSEEKLGKFEKKFDKKHSNISYVDYKKIVIGLIILILIVFLMYGLILIFTPPKSSPTEFPEIARILTSYLFKKRI